MCRKLFISLTFTFNQETLHFFRLAFQLKLQILKRRGQSHNACDCCATIPGSNLGYSFLSLFSNLGSYASCKRIGKKNTRSCDMKLACASLFILYCTRDLLPVPVQTVSRQILGMAGKRKSSPVLQTIYWPKISHLDECTDMNLCKNLKWLVIFMKWLLLFFETSDN